MLVTCFLTACSIPLYAAEVLRAGLPDGLKLCGSYREYTVISGDQIQLPDNTILRLQDIKAPEFWPQGSPYKSWPYGSRSKSALNDYLSGYTLTAFCNKKHKTHSGDTLAHIKRGKEWVQQWMVKNGHAYVFPAFGVGLQSQELRGDEALARQANIGLWASNEATTVSATSDQLRPSWFQLVRGTVISANSVRKTHYLNFGDNWRKDFTVQFGNKVEKQLQALEISVRSLKGKTLEVRGYVEWSAGPKIIVTHADQIRIIELP